MSDQMNLIVDLDVLNMFPYIFCFYLLGFSKTFNNKVEGQRSRSSVTFDLKTKWTIV